MAKQQSTFKRAMTLLDTMTTATRPEILHRLRVAFPDAADEYIKTLWANHRRISKDNGSLIEIFSIKDIKEGKPCEPYLKSEFTFHPEPDDCITPELAKFKWVQKAKSKIVKVEHL